MLLPVTLTSQVLMNGASPPKSNTATLYVNAAPVERTPHRAHLRQDDGNWCPNEAHEKGHGNLHCQQRLKRWGGHQVMKGEPRDDAVSKHAWEEYSFASIAV